MYKKLREPINSITHFVGAGLSFIALIIYLIFNRSNVLCSIAEFRYGMGHTQSALKLYKFAAKIGKIKFSTIFYLTQCVQNSIISTYNQNKNLPKSYFTLIVLVSMLKD